MDCLRILAHTFGIALLLLIVLAIPGSFMKVPGSLPPASRVESATNVTSPSSFLNLPHKKSSFLGIFAVMAPKLIQSLSCDILVL